MVLNGFRPDDEKMLACPDKPGGVRLPGPTGGGPYHRSWPAGGTGTGRSGDPEFTEATGDGVAVAGAQLEVLKSAVPDGVWHGKLRVPDV